MTLLRSLLLDTRDGEWGKGEPGAGRTKMRVVRGTDFMEVREGRVSGVPWRFLENRHAERKRLQDWDIILETAGGSPDRPTGRSVLLTPRVMEALGAEVTCASFARFLRVDPTKAHPAFVFWLLQHLYATRAIAQFNTQHTGVARFQFTTFCDTFELKLPPIAEQRGIAAILGEYDDLIEVNGQRVALLEDLASSLFDEWFVRFQFPGHEDGRLASAVDGTLPQGWASAKIGSILRKFRRPEKVKRQEYVSAGKIPCIDQGASFIGGYTDNDAALIDNPLPMCVFGDHTRVLKFVTFPFASGADGTQLMYPTGDITPEYLYYALRRVNVANQHYARHFKFLKEKEIIVPPSDLIEKFTSIVKPFTKKLENIRLQNASLVASRDIILGQLPVAVAERDLLEVV